MTDGYPGTVRPRGCMMVDSLYVKANGEMPCWDDVGEQRILRALEPAALAAGRESPLLDTPGLVHLRRAFREGRLPWPGLCEGCAVLGHGEAPTHAPRALEVLHVEPSYLCHLSCPQCIPARARRRTKAPPYHMSVPFWTALLRQLRREGIGRIRFILFEGRGDPLTNPRLGEMIAAVGEYYPEALTTVTTHGSFPYRSWLAECGLDVLRLSVDGATPASYARYRVGGDLERVFALMRSVRDARRCGDGRPRMLWKYILFEWNDSDDELRLAAERAKELEADLSFCLTHSPGRSRRFRSSAELADALSRLGLHAACDLTFQMKSAGEADVRGAVAEHAQALLLRAKAALGQGSGGQCCRMLRAALMQDPGIGIEDDAEDPVARHWARILAEAAPATLSALANLERQRGNHERAARLFERYLEYGPPDVTHVRQAMVDARLRAAFLRVREGDLAGARARVSSALRHELGAEELPDADPDDGLKAIRRRLLEVLARASPGSLSLLANIAREAGDHESAARLFERYLEFLPAEAESVRAAMVECVLRTALDRAYRGEPEAARALAHAALISHLGPARGGGDPLAHFVVSARPHHLELLANVYWASGYLPAACYLFDAYVEREPAARDRQDIREARMKLRQPRRSRYSSSHT